MSIQLHSLVKKINNWINQTTQRRLVIWSISFWLGSIAILSIIFSFVGENQMLAESRLRNTQFASTISRDVNTQISRIVGNARTFTQHMAVLEPDLETQAGALLGLRLSSTRYRAAYYFDANSTLLFELTDTIGNLRNVKIPSEITSRPAASPGTEIMDIYKATIGAGISISNVYYTTLDYVPVLDIGMDVFFPSGEKRVIVFQLDLTDIWQKIDTATIGHTGITYAVSHEGKVIAHPDPAFIGRQIPDEIRPVIDNYEGSVQFVDPFTDRYVIAAYSPVGGQTGWGIVVQQDRTEINAFITKTITTVIIVLLVLGVFGTASILFLIGGFTRPIKELTRTTKDIARTGNLTKTNITQRSDEVAQLNQAFDQMIDKLKDAEGKLTISEERYRSLFEHANDAIFLVREDTFIDCNRKTEEIFGCHRKDIIGQKPYEFSPPQQPDGRDSEEKALEMINAALSGNPQSFEWKHSKLNGSLFDAEVSLNRIEIEGGPILLAIVRDITDRKRSEEALKQAQKEREEAATAERTRLAHDLHDAVSQTLFSASIIAEVLPRLWDKNPDEGRRRLEEIRQLTRGALAEMRTLLFELRPAALADAELGYLLNQLAESITGRSRMPVDVFIEGQCDLQSETKIALYRITQEALNNVAKHANASKASVNLSYKPGEVSLIISDNGNGFDVATVNPESLGLGIMRDRAKGIGGYLKINSKPGIGSEVEVIVKLRNTATEVQK